MIIFIFCNSQNFSDQYIKNPNFTDGIIIPSIGWSYYNNDQVQFWKSSSCQIEIGKAKIFNPNWEEGVYGVDSDSSQSDFISQEFDFLVQVKCELSFRYSNRPLNTFESQGLQVLFNDAVVFNQYLDSIATPTEFKTIVTSKIGKNKIEFKAYGKSDQIGAVFAKPSLLCEKFDSNPLSYTQEMIVNGSFKNGLDPTKLWAVYAESVAAPWKSTNKKLEIGNGKQYNLNWNFQDKVAELDINVNETISQEFTLSKDLFCLVKFRYAGRVKNGITIIDGFRASINSNILFEKETLPNLNVVNFEVFLKLQGGLNKISFTGLGLSNVIGVTITDVSVKCNPNS